MKVEIEIPEGAKCDSCKLLCYDMGTRCNYLDEPLPYWKAIRAAGYANVVDIDLTTKHPNCPSLK